MMTNPIYRIAAARILGVTVDTMRRNPLPLRKERMNNVDVYEFAEVLALAAEKYRDIPQEVIDEINRIRKNPI